MASGEPGLVYVLVEHKSYSDSEAVLQMLSYMVRIWQRHVNGKGNEGRTARAARARTLPPIIPLLAYSGTRPWTGPTNFADMFATDDPNLTLLYANGRRCHLKNYLVIRYHERDYSR